MKGLRHFGIYLALRIVGLILSCVGTLVFATHFEHSKWIYLAGALWITMQGWWLYKHLTNVNRKLIFFLESVRYSDFTSQFKSDNHKGTTFKGLNEQFNEVLEAFRQARAEKEAQHQYLNTIVQQIATGIISFSAEGKVSMANTAALRMLDMRRIQRLSDLSDPHPELYKILAEFSPGIRSVYQSPHDERLSIQGAEIHLRGSLLRMVVLQNIQTELQQQEINAWQNLSRVLRHEIMNSLTPLVSMVGTMRQIVTHDLQDANPEAISDLSLALTTIEKRSKGLMQFVEAYRDFTNLPKPHPTDISVSECLSEVLNLFQPKLEMANVTIETSVSPQNLHIHADPLQLQQVLINLVKNALESFSSQANPHIDITVGYASERMHLRIQDNGDGIEPEALENIFIPFFTTKKTGSGIGLSLSRQIVQQHGGQIKVSSEVGVGTTFLIIL